MTPDLQDIASAIAMLLFASGLYLACERIAAFLAGA